MPSICFAAAFIRGAPFWTPVASQAASAIKKVTNVTTADPVLYMSQRGSAFRAKSPREQKDVSSYRCRMTTLLLMDDFDLGGQDALVLPRMCSVRQTGASHPSLQYLHP